MLTVCRALGNCRARSIADIQWFWDAISKFLGIEWLSPYSRILDLSEGIQWPKWFVDGKINLAQNCLDKQLNEKFRKDRAAFGKR